MAEQQESQIKLKKRYRHKRIKDIPILTMEDRIASALAKVDCRDYGYKPYGVCVLRKSAWNDKDETYDVLDSDTYWGWRFKARKKDARLMAKMFRRVTNGKS